MNVPTCLPDRPHSSFYGIYPQNKGNGMEIWSKMEEEHLCCSSGLPGYSCVAVNAQRAFIQHYTVCMQI